VRRLNNFEKDVTDLVRRQMLFVARQMQQAMDVLHDERRLLHQEHDQMRHENRLLHQERDGLRHENRLLHQER
jgi:hypothetical protein